MFMFLKEIKRRIRIYTPKQGMTTVIIMVTIMIMTMGMTIAEAQRK
jgi:hypothetical protein